MPYTMASPMNSWPLYQRCVGNKWLCSHNTCVIRGLKSWFEICQKWVINPCLITVARSDPEFIVRAGKIPTEYFVRHQQQGAELYTNVRGIHIYSRDVVDTAATKVVSDATLDDNLFTILGKYSQSSLPNERRIQAFVYILIATATTIKLVKIQQTTIRVVTGEPPMVKENRLCCYLTRDQSCRIKETLLIIRTSTLEQPLHVSGSSASVVP